MAITPGAGYEIDPTNPNAVRPIQAPPTPAPVASATQNKAPVAPTPTPAPAQTSVPNGYFAPDVSKAGTSGYDPYGNKLDRFAPSPSSPTTSSGTPPSGMSQDDYNSFKAANPNLEPNSMDVTRNQLAQAQADYQAVAQKAADTITNIQNGSIPLNAGEQAQVDGLKAQFQDLIQQQQVTNVAAEGTAQVRGFQVGAGEYDPTFQAKTIGNIVSAGIGKVADLNSKMASSVATLTQALKDNDIRAVKDAYAIYKDASNARTEALQKTLDESTQAIKDAQAEYDKQQQYNLDVAKFNQLGDQQSFDNAFKLEQEKFNQQKDTATANETNRHNLVNEGIDAFKAGMGAGGAQVGVTQSATILPDGNPDPVSQKAVLDQITQQYGPMTAVAIQGLADYTMNPTDWSSRTGGKGMTREQAVTLAKMVDPTYNDANYAPRAAMLKSIASAQTGTIGSAVNAANKSINHLTAFVTTMNQIGNGPISAVNSFNQKFNTTNQTLRANVAAAQTEGLGVAEELAKFFKGSGTVDVASIEAWKSHLNTAASPADVKGLTQGAITLLSGQLETLAEQYQATMGKAPPTDFLNQSARANLSSLKNQGYEVDIPGINYTDKNAYIKNDPSAQSNMNTAIDRLTKAGIPITPENILQMAQNLDAAPDTGSPPQSFNSVGGDTNSASGIIKGYDITSYATDPTHEAKVTAITNRIGTPQTPAQVDKYIMSVAPHSPVKGSDVIAAANATGTPPELIMALMQQDSSFGTAGKAVRTLNPGNVGNTDSGATQSYPSWAAGVMAVAKNLQKRKVNA